MIFSKSWCPFSAKAKSIFTSNRIDWKAVEIDLQSDGEKIQAELFKMTGQNGVPYIFIGGIFRGGSDELEEAEKDGTLTELIQNA